MEKITIGVTDCSKFGNYSKWMASYASTVEVIKLSEKTNNLEEVKKCNAVLFSGGEDVHPQFYHKPEYLSYCHASDINQKRDEFELKLMEYTEKNSIPVLGVCRGLQLFNVFKKGTLIPDLPSFGKFNHSKLEDDSDRPHSILVDPNSYLAKHILHTEKGVINSNHHQSADLIGEGLVASAFSEDGVVEAIERIDSSENGFLLLVQWHPERMTPSHSIFVEGIRRAFFNAIKNK
jgi:putative glutamine amidotransferase